MATIGWLLGVAILGGQGAAQDSFCVYFADSATGNLQRMRLDGTGRELVIRCKPGNIALAPTLPSAKARGQLHVSGIPSRGGFTVVDASAPRSVSMASVPMPSGSMRFIDESRGAWSVKVVTSRGSVEPGHVHDHPSSYELRTGNKSISLRTSTSESAILALFPTLAIVRDGTQILRWDLVTDTKKVIASATSVAVWPRDLRQSTRFKPICKGSLNREVYEWTMKHPNDFVVKPEYRKQSKPAPSR